MRNPDPKFNAGYQAENIHTRRILLVAGGVGLMIAVSGLLSALLFYRLTPGATSLRGAPDTEHRLPPKPQLQVDASQELAAVRAAETAHLNRYTWVDREQGVVSLPVERAIELLSERGLPARGKSQ